VRTLETRLVVVRVLVCILTELKVFAVVLLPILVVVVVSFVRITSLHWPVTTLVCALTIICLLVVAAMVVAAVA